MNITKNFTLEEMVHTNRKIKNVPNDEEKENINKLVKEVLQPIRDKFGEPIVVSSGFRCAKLNKAVGGVANSDHLFGCAADIHTTSDTVEDNKRLWNCIMSMMGELKCRQIINEYNYNWIHISINNTHNQYRLNQIVRIK